MTGNADYWAHVSAAFVGAGALVILVTIGATVIGLVQRKRAEREVEPLRDVHGELVDEPAKLDLPKPSKGSGRPNVAALFEPAYDLREVDQDTAAMHAVRAEMDARPQRLGPPMIEGLSLFAYLKHHAPSHRPAVEWDAEGLGVWANVVEDFYTAAGADQRIAHHFEGVRLTDLKRHFVRALVTLANVGLTAEQADEVGRAHWYLGITEAEFDATTGHLVQTLQRYMTAQAFDHVLPQLSPAVAALRVRIVNPDRSQRPAGRS